MTTHAAATFKNIANGIVVPKCKQFATSVSYGATTTDAAQVTCARCRKSLGLAVEAKATVEVVHARHLGTKGEPTAHVAKCATMDYTARFDGGSFAVTDDASKVTCERCKRSRK